MDSFLGEIRPVAFPFAPVNWALCQGQTMAIRQYTALFSLLGTSYGGDGVQTFKLPNLGGQAVVGVGQGQGLSAYTIGQVAGTETVTLTLEQMPAHLHGLSGSFPVQTASANSASAAGSYPASTKENQYSEGAGGSGTMAPLVQGAAGPAGSGQPHANMMPSLCINYIICLNGEFPQRS